MRPTVTQGATHNYQAPENWNEETEGPCGDLQVRASTFGEREIIELTSTWKPTEFELAKLNAGGVIEVGLCLVNQPPMRVYVVDPVEPALIKYVAPQAESTLNDDAEIDVLLNGEKPPITINEAAHGDDAEDHYGLGGRGASHG